MIGSKEYFRCQMSLCSADAQDRELLARHNITHILSIHDTAAPILEVSCLLCVLLRPVGPSDPNIDTAITCTTSPEFSVALFPPKSPYAWSEIMKCLQHT